MIKKKVSIITLTSQIIIIFKSQWINIKANNFDIMLAKWIINNAKINYIKDHNLEKLKIMRWYYNLV